MALQFVEDAYNVLSDPIKCSGFDARRKLSGVIFKENHNSDVPTISGNRLKYPDLLHSDEEQNGEGVIMLKRFCTVSANNFECDQVWSCYDRCTCFVKYAWIVSVEPEQSLVKVNWYKPCPKSDKERIWCDAGLPISCGEFVQQESALVALDGPTKFSQLLFS
jgi:Domain of unknown function (DUF3444)